MHACHISPQMYFLFFRLSVQFWWKKLLYAPNSALHCRHLSVGAGTWSRVNKVLLPSVWVLLGGQAGNSLRGYNEGSDAFQKNFTLMPNSLYSFLLPVVGSSSWKIRKDGSQADQRKSLYLILYPRCGPHDIPITRSQPDSSARPDISWPRSTTHFSKSTTSGTFSTHKRDPMTVFLK